MNALPALDCNQVVELITDYLEGALDEPTAQRVREHLAGCRHCDTYLDQIRRTVQFLGQVDSGALSPKVQEDLVVAFRGFRHPS